MFKIVLTFQNRKKDYNQMRNKWWEKTVPKYGSQLKIYKGALICFILPPYTISYGPSQNSIYIEQK